MNGESLPGCPSCRCCGCIPHPSRLSTLSFPGQPQLAGMLAPLRSQAEQLAASLLPPWTLAATSRGRGVGATLLPAALGSSWGHCTGRDWPSLSSPGTEQPPPGLPTGKRAHTVVLAEMHPCSWSGGLGGAIPLSPAGAEGAPSTSAAQVMENRQ